MPSSFRRAILYLLIGTILGLIISPIMWLQWTSSLLIEDEGTKPLCPPQLLEGGTVALPQNEHNVTTSYHLSYHLEEDGGEVNAPRDPSIRRKHLSQELAPRSLLFTGVLTAQKYLNTRALAIWKTWGKELSDIYFFSSPPEDAYLRKELPVITLPGINDTEYPPQKKVYRMLKYMHDHFIDNFDFFMRADDDSYVKTDRLLELLKNINPAQDIYMGGPGFGRSNDLERIKLKEEEHYCQGGPGVIFSRSALRKLAPHLEDCLNVSKAWFTI